MTRHNSIFVSLVASAGLAISAFADYTYTIADPSVAFNVMDLVPYDGIGDSGPFDYDVVIKGTEGEKRNMAEFDLSGFSIPAGEQIASAVFEAFVYSDYVGGLGSPFGQLPTFIAADGYVGNGLAELDDFQAGNGNFLDHVSGQVAYGDVLAFDVTGFIQQLVAAGQQWAGLTLRAEDIGGLSTWDGPVGYPALTIMTAPIPEPATLTLLALAGLATVRRPRNSGC